MKKDRKNNNDEKKGGLLLRLIPLGTLLSLALPIIYLTVKMLREPGYDPATMLMLLQCLLGLIAFFLPNFLSKKWRLNIPSGMYIAFIIFLYCAIFLGEVRDFFYKIPHWDDILHFFSGMMCGALGFSVVALLNKSQEARLNMSPAFVVMFSIFFAVTIGVVWEIYEYTFDGLLGLNMQKFMLADGTQLVGHAALTDTMQDLMVDLGGATLAAMLGYFSIKKKEPWLKDFVITQQEEKQPENK